MALNNTKCMFPVKTSNKLTQVVMTNDGNIQEIKFNKHF